MKIRPFIPSCLRGCPRISFYVISTEGRNPKLKYFQCNKISRYARNNNIGEFSNRLLDQEGAVLIGLIITMVILAVLGVAMFSLTGTSTLSQVGANSSARAYYLAESGYRYTKSQYDNAADENAKDSALEAMHNKTFTLLGNDGKFTLEIYPYYFKTTEAPTGNTLKTKVPGGVLSELKNAVENGGYLKIAGHVYQYTSASVTSYSIVTFTKSSNWPYIPENTDVLSVAKSKAGESQIVSKGGSLTLEAGTPDAFPSRNGTVQVNGHIYSYKQLDLANNQLTGIEDPSDPNMPSFTVASNTDITLQKFVKLHSTGTFGQGSAATSREIVYHVPLPILPYAEKVEFHETFEEPITTHWKAPTLGSHAVKTIGDDKALKVTGTGSVRGGAGDVGSLIALEWKTTEVKLGKAHKFAGHFLSYDAQVKVGFNPSVPSTYMAGISFRLDNDGNSYGISYLRGGSSDGIPDDLVPLNNWPMIVLWQQTNAPSFQRKWLAYKHLTGRPVFFTDDMESGKSKWQADRPWDHIITDFHSPRTCWTDSPVGDYAENVDTSLETKSINLSGASSAKLSFWHHYAIFPWFGPPFNFGGRADIEVSTDGGITWPTRLMRYGGVQDDWTNEIIDLSTYAGQSDVRIRFRLRSVDDPWGLFYVGRDGWYIDDVIVAEDFPINEATIMARVKEVASVEFNNGGPTPIEDGDKVMGETTGAQGTVRGTPILSSGSWAAANAAGIITLNKVTGTFQNGETLLVIGSSATATVQGYRDRDNYIKAYYGDLSGYGTANANPLDYSKCGNPRGEVHWPPDEVEDWAPDNDYFTLIQWDAINTSVGSVALIPSLSEPNAIIRTNAITTPSSGTFDWPELGLHTFGTNSTNVYFDDFALQAEVPISQEPIHLPPIQE